MRARLVTWIAFGGLGLLVASAAIHDAPFRTREPQRFAFTKGDPDDVRPGDNKRAMVGANENRWPEYTPEVEKYLLRAYPAPDISGESTLNAHAGWAALNAGQHSNGAWDLIG